MKASLALSAPGFYEVLVLAVLALLIFGPERLPGMARSAGRMLAQFKREASSTMDELRRAAELDEIRDVVGELRSTRSELERTAALTAGTAAAKRAERPEQARASTPAEPPPFDPDAT